MKKILAAIGLSVVIFGATIPIANTAQAARVSGYLRSNGTYVQPHYRSNPNAFRYDNYSYSGGSRYNHSYFAPTKNYSNTWYTPSYRTQPDYYVGKSYYNAHHYTR